jgi:hypothetical protein
MRSAWLILAALIGLRSISVPTASETLMDSGNAFERACSSIDMMGNESVTQVELLHAMACAAYVKGLTDGIDLEIGTLEAEGKAKVPEPYCSKDAGGVEQAQKVRIVLNYIRKNPDKAHLPTVVLFAFAMQEAFPRCPEKK